MFNPRPGFESYIVVIYRTSSVHQLLPPDIYVCSLRLLLCTLGHSLSFCFPREDILNLIPSVHSPSSQQPVLTNSDKLCAEQCFSFKFVLKRLRGPTTRHIFAQYPLPEYQHIQLLPSFSHGNIHPTLSPLL